MNTSYARRLSVLSAAVATMLAVATGCTASVKQSSTPAPATSDIRASLPLTSLGSTVVPVPVQASGTSNGAIVSASSPATSSTAAADTSSADAPSASAPTTSPAATSPATSPTATSPVATSPAATSPTGGSTSAQSAATSTAAPRATTPVPAPGGGNISQTVATGVVTTRPAVPLTSAAAYGNGVTVAIASVRRITTTAELPGEIAGPGVQLTLRFANASSAAIDLGNVVVDLQDADGVSATAMSSGARPVSGPLASKASSTGIYVFTLGKDFPVPAHVSVSYSAQAPVVLFSGPIS